MKFLFSLLFISGLANAFDVTNLVGKYAHYDIVAYKDKFLGPINLKSNIISYGITDLFVKEGKLYSKDRFCFSDYKANIPFNSKTSDEFTKAIIPKIVEMEVLKTGNDVRLYRPETPTLVGVKLDSYLEDFPEDPTSPLFVDDDKDGKPGITVNLSLGQFFQEELYIARKEIFSYDMKLNENGVISGIVRDRSQQYIISASRDDLVDGNNPPQNPNLSLSPIYLAPIDADIDCDSLKAGRDKYFPKNYRKHKKFYNKYSK